jgi:hypothetical protein
MSRQYDAWMDEVAERDEERLLEQYYEQQLNEWNGSITGDQLSNEANFFEVSSEGGLQPPLPENTQEEYTQTSPATTSPSKLVVEGLRPSDQEDDDDNTSVSTVVIYPTVATTNQGAYVYCRHTPIISNVIEYDSD